MALRDQTLGHFKPLAFTPLAMTLWVAAVVSGCGVHGADDVGLRRRSWRDEIRKKTPNFVSETTRTREERTALAA
jgi:hypothetical protein